jgi:hypothetical protein
MTDTTSSQLPDRSAWITLGTCEHWHRGRCLIVLVESRPNVEGRRISFTDVYVSRIRGRECVPPDDPQLVRAGNWVTSMAKPKQDEKWRIEYGSWRVDIELREIAYDTAKRVVRTARREGLAERCFHRLWRRDQAWFRRYLGCDAGFGGAGVLDLHSPR